ncbi:hypothetical protein CSAL01_04327 [Colletotrichum salicis]|uniref:Uncharacterized protein n=1 Tax=Colletotrichum salicis TaxID=1209931 RepID=A0A135UA88_9PEZI|nr:hypothetical protein CSAL01_04327 [Colletotrichum salicis]
MRTQPVAPRILVFPETRNTQPPAAWDGRNGRGEIVAPNDEPLGAITITRAISEALSYDTGHYDGTTVLIQRHAGTAPPLLEQFPSIFFSKFATENPPPYGKQRRTPATPNSPPLLAVPLSGLLPRGSSMGRCNPRGGSLFLTSSEQGRAAGWGMAMKSPYSASAWFTTQFERGYGRRLTLRSSGFYKEHAHVETGRDSDATAAFPEAVNLALSQRLASVNRAKEPASDAQNRVSDKRQNASYCRATYDTDWIFLS